jgi:cadmium resistance protein CadD (predicted permease)
MNFIPNPWLAMFVFMFIAYSVSNILVHSKLFKGLRYYSDKYSPKFFGQLLSCMMCISPWVGFAMSIMFSWLGWFVPHMVLGGGVGILPVFIDGVFVGGVVWFIHTVQEFFERGFVKDEVVEDVSAEEPTEKKLLLD